MKLKMCYDTKSKSSLMFMKTVRNHYSTIKMHKMKNEQRIRCRDIEGQKKFDMWIELSIRNKIINENFVIIKKKFHVISNLSCFLIMKTDLMKAYDIISKWNKKKETDLMIIQKKHRIAVIVTKNSSAKFKKIKKATSLLTIALSIKIKILNPSKRRQINVYAEKNKIIEFEHEINVLIMRKPLVLSNYIFRSIHKRNLATESYLIEMNVVISDTWNSTSMTNLKKTSIKIYKSQFFERFNLYRNQNLTSSVSTNFHHADVFFEKKINKMKFEFNSNDVLFEKTVPENDSNESVNSFFIESINSNDVLKSDVSDHWKENFKKKIQKILINHFKLFRPNLKKFNNDIKMFISFKNETNVEKLKQISYSMSTKNRKAMNEILNSLTKKNWMQKISLKTVSSVFFSTFVIWKNEKFRVIIDLKKINTRLYSNAYSLFKQNVIFSFLNEFEIFSSIDLIKNFFQQEIKPKNRWKTTFVTPHRGLKWLTVSNMKFGNTSDFFQNRMKKVFKTYLWKFVLIYMNDIIVYSKNKNQHLTHLKKILNLLEKSDVILTLKKCHFAYFSIKVLKHHVSKLELNILKKKTKIIRKF